MSERERWIVYPLLFLAMGAALRDKLFDRTTSKSIVCQELIVVEDDRGGRPGRVLARIGTTDPAERRSARGGQMFVDGQLLARTVSADNFAYRGVPFSPSLRAILPGISPTDLLRALQQSAEAFGRGTAQESPDEPRANDQQDQALPQRDDEGQTPQSSPQ